MRYYVLQARLGACTSCTICQALLMLVRCASVQIMHRMLVRCASVQTRQSAPTFMQACEQIGIPVVEKAPDPMRSDTWREAFVTNWCAPVAPACGACLCSHGKGGAVSAEMPRAPQCAGHAAAAAHCSASLHLGSTWLPGACDSAFAAGTVKRYEHGFSPLLVTLVDMRDDAQATRIC